MIRGRVGLFTVLSHKIRVLNLDAQLLQRPRFGDANEERRVVMDADQHGRKQSQQRSFGKQTQLSDVQWSWNDELINRLLDEAVIPEDLMLFFIIYDVKLNYLWCLDCWLNKTNNLNTSARAVGKYVAFSY